MEDYSMAWVTSGSFTEKAETKWKSESDKELDNNITKYGIINCGDECCLAF